jgi:hypothetical protein
MLACLFVIVVARYLERLPYHARLAPSIGRQTFEGMQSRTPPRPIDEVVALRLQQGRCKLRGDGGVATQQSIGGGAHSGNHFETPQYATALYVKT